METSTYKIRDDEDGCKSLRPNVRSTRCGSGVRGYIKPGGVRQQECRLSANVYRCHHMSASDDLTPVQISITCGLTTRRPAPAYPAEFLARRLPQHNTVAIGFYTPARFALLTADMSLLEISWCLRRPRTALTDLNPEPARSSSSPAFREQEVAAAEWPPFRER